MPFQVPHTSVRHAIETGTQESFLTLSSCSYSKNESRACYPPMHSNLTTWVQMNFGTSRTVYALHIRLSVLNKWFWYCKGRQEVTCYSKEKEKEVVCQDSVSVQLLVAKICVMCCIFVAIWGCRYFFKVDYTDVTVPIQNFFC